MRILLLIAAGFWIWLTPVRADTPPSAAPPEVAGGGAASQPGRCTGKSAKECGVSKEDFKKARDAFDRGLRLRDTDPQEALSAFNLAVQLVPQDGQYIAARELCIQQLAYGHIQRGNQLLSQKNTVDAATEFYKALELDPKNQFASQRLLDATHAPEKPRPAYTDREWEAGEIKLRPKAGQQTIHLATDTQAAYTTVAAAFGIKAKFDSSAPATNLRLDLNQVTFEQAMNAVALVSHTFWTPASSSEVLVAADTPPNRREFERWVMRTFYLPEVSSAQELADITNLLHTLFDLRFLTPSSRERTITVRGPASTVKQVTEFLHTLWLERPQVMLDFDVYEITGQTFHDMGVGWPSQITMFNFPQGPAVSVSSGGQQLNSLSLPVPNGVITFGGGQSRMGIQLPSAVANFSKNTSQAIALSKTSLQASQGKPTTFRLGTRYPVITSSYTGMTSLAASPSTAFVDLGLTIKATPVIHKSDVTLQIEVELSSLGSELFNGIPSINNRQYTGTMTVRDDEPAVVAAALSRTDILSLQRIPGLGDLPGLGRLFSNHSTETDDDELLIMITPHVVSAPRLEQSTELLVPSN